MAKFHLTNKALEDLSKIWEYTYEVWSENQADKYYELLLDACRELAKNPKVGKNYDHINPELLGYTANKHIIFYQIISKTEVLIVRILHERMDLENRL